MLLAVAAVVVASGCVSPRTDPRPPADPDTTIRVRVGGSVIDIPIESYVRTVILSEFAPGAGDRQDTQLVEEMLEVQAIVSRTYARTPRHRAEGFDVCATTHCQLYEPVRASKSRWIGAADDAVRKTAGVLVWFADSPAHVVYHADCGGRTSSAHDVWNGTRLPYLVGGADDEPGASHRRWQFTAENASLRAALNADGRTRVGAFLNRIDVLRRDGAGRAQLIALDGERSPVIRGEEFRTLMARRYGATGLRSTSFDVVRTDRGFEFTGRGFGHGVGLCQAGAFARISAGATPTAVLAHYFPGTSIH